MRHAVEELEISALLLCPPPCCLDWVASLQKKMLNRLVHDKDARLRLQISFSPLISSSEIWNHSIRQRVLKLIQGAPGHEELHFS